MIFVENYPLAAAVREADHIKDYVGCSPIRLPQTGLWKIKLIKKKDLPHNKKLDRTQS